MSESLSSDRSAAVRKRSLSVEKGDTLANVLRRRIADDIMANVYEPGMRLDETRLAEAYGVSRTPVREALRQLAAAGLVATKPHAGAVIQPIDRHHVAQLCEAAIEIEAVCARLAANRMTRVEVASLREILSEARAAEKAGAAEAFALANRRFHSAVIAGAHNPHLAAAAEMCRLRLAPYQKLQFQTGDRRRSVLVELEALFEALEAQHGARAVAAMDAHLTAAALVIGRHLERLEAR